MRRALLLLAPLAIACTNEESWRFNERILNKNATEWPRYVDKMPPPVNAPSPASPGSVVLIFPAIEAPQVLHWDEGESVRLVVPRTPASVLKTLAQGRPVGDLRTRDFELPDPTYAAMRCGFGRRWAGPPSEKATFAAVYFCKSREDDSAARAATTPIVESVLEDLRVRAAESGATIASDIRCYLVKPPRARVWCEATGEL